MNIVAVQVGNFCGLGKEYTAAYFNGMRRNLTGEHRYFCLTDDPSTVPDGVEAIAAEPGISGWWNKLAMFKPGKLPDGQAFFADLDVVVVGSMDDFMAYRGPLIGMNDPYFKNNFGSAMMSWDVGAQHHIWETWDRAGRPQSDPKGDQAYIESVSPRSTDRWQNFLPGRIVSYKADCLPLGGVMPNASIIVFHGKPRPHEARDEFFLPLRPVELSGAMREEDGLVLLDGIWRPTKDYDSVHYISRELWKIGEVARHMSDRRVCVQAGGHVGLFASTLAPLFEEVHTFEPDKKHYNCLLRNTAAHNNITPHLCALGSEQKNIRLSQRERHNTGTIRFDEDGDIEAACITIDSLGLKNVDLIYFDIEGMEGPALKGAEKTIKGFRPVIVCERNGLEIKGTEGMIESFMKANDYVQISRLMRDDVFVHRDELREASNP